MSGFGGSSGSTVDTELPAASDESDGKSDVSTSQIDSRLAGYNGTTWDRIRTAISTATSVTTGVLNALGLMKYNTAAPTLTDGQFVVQQCDDSGNLKVITQSSALPTGAATATKQDTGNTSLSSIDGKLSSLGQKVKATSVPVTIASDQDTLVVSDGAGSLTVDGTVTSNIGATNGLALDATLTGGTQKAITRGGAKGGTSAADVTSTAIDVDHQALDIADGGGSLTVDGTVTSNIGTTNGLALDATLTGGTHAAIVRGGAKGATAAATITSTANGADHQGLDVIELLGAAAEDNTNGVIAGQTKLLAVNTYSPSLATNLGANTAGVAKASAGNVYAVTFSNENLVARFLQLHNKATTPAAAEAPIYSFYVANGASRTIGAEFFLDGGANFATGIGWAWSTTKATFTDSATASEHVVHIHYK